MGKKKQSGLLLWTTVNLPILATGCSVGGSGGLFGLFGSGPAIEEVLGLFVAGHVDDDSGGPAASSVVVTSSLNDSESDESTIGDGVVQQGTIANPEPASGALFSAGVAGLVLINRQRGRKSSGSTKV